MGAYGDADCGRSGIGAGGSGRYSEEVQRRDSMLPFRGADCDRAARSGFCTRSIISAASEEEGDFEGDRARGTRMSGGEMEFVSSIIFKITASVWVRGFVSSSTGDISGDLVVRLRDDLLLGLLIGLFCGGE